MRIKDIIDKFPTDSKLFKPNPDVILGIDASISGPGFAILNKKENSIVFCTQKLTDKKATHNYSRQKEFYLKVVNYINTVKPENVFIEGYSYASTTAAYDMGELGGLLRMLMEDYKELGIHTTLVPPKTLKKYAAGSGNANKELMLLNIYKRWSIECRDNNEADAVGLCMYGYNQLTGKDLIPDNLKIIRE